AEAAIRQRLTLPSARMWLARKDGSSSSAASTTTRRMAIGTLNVAAARAHAADSRSTAAGMRRTRRASAALSAGDVTIVAVETNVHAFAPEETAAASQLPSGTAVILSSLNT